MDNLVDLLLKADQNKFAKPVRNVEIKRLSKVIGQKALFKCEAIDADIYNDIQQNAIDMDKKGNLRNINMGEIQLHMVLEGVKEPSFKNKELLQHYKAATPFELIKKLLLPGEITELFNAINELSGFDAEKSEEENESIKNL